MLAQRGQQVEHRLVDLALPLGVREQAEAQIVEHGEAGKDAAPLRHVGDAGARPLVGAPGPDLGAVEPDAAGGPVHQPEDRAHQRGLAHTVAAEHGEELAVADAQAHILQCAAIAVVGIDGGKLKHR